MVQTLFDRLLPRGKADGGRQQTLAALLEQNGFDRAQHEQIRADLKEGRIGLAQNRLPASAVIEDVQDGDVLDATCAAVKGFTRRRPRRPRPRRGGRGDAGRRRRQPLDPGRGRGQGPASLLQTGRRTPHLHRDAPGQEPAHLPPGGPALAAHLHHQLPDPQRHGRFLARQNNYGYPGPLVSVARHVPSACA